MEKILRREDGSQVRILISLYSLSGRHQYSYSIYTRGYRCKNWIHGNKEMKCDYDSLFESGVVTKEEVLSAMMEFHESIKPTINNI